MLNRIAPFVLFVLLIGTQNSVSAQVRIKDIAEIKGFKELQLIGYGIVVGLNGTGDGQRTIFTKQSVVNMLKRFSINVPQDKVRSGLDNVASVIVTAKLSPFAKEGSTFDVVVSSLGDATSLEGGTLLLTPLTGSGGLFYGNAQGSISVGAFSVETEGGSSIRKNHPLVGRVPNGAMLESDLPFVLSPNESLEIVLRLPDFTTSLRAAEAIDDRFGNTIAQAQDPATILVAVPGEYQQPGRFVEFIASIEAVNITPDVVARVVINERTGTIAVGENVKISTVAVSHGNITIEISARPIISQPAPFSAGETVVERETEAYVTTEIAEMIIIEETADVSDVAKALNALGVTPRDIIAIFQALKEAGALNAQLVIM